MNTPTIRVLALSRRQEHHYAPLSSALNITLTEDWSVEMLCKHAPDILLTLTDDWYEAYKVIQEARRLKIPSLLMMDGIIEWRHIWEDPFYASGGGIGFYQPIQTDKVACLGWLSARTFEAWGNVGRCEVVGAPRFDHYLTEPIPPRTSHEGRKRLLILTANTPGFTPEQIRQVEQALQDVNSYLQKQSIWEPIWRVRKGLDEKLGLHDSFSELRNEALPKVLAESDAVLTTPSTVILESMLAQKPTAILDYSNSPPYVNAAWSITSREQIAPVLEMLQEPETARIVYQQEILYNHLECRTAASPRLVKLIQEMALIGREARQNDQNLSFPARMIPIELGGHAVPTSHFDWSRLYPAHPVFSNNQIQALQIELVHARAEIKDLKNRLWKAKRGSPVYALARRLLRKS